MFNILQVCHDQMKTLRYRRNNAQLALTSRKRGMQPLDRCTKGTSVGKWCWCRIVLAAGRGLRKRKILGQKHKEGGPTREWHQICRGGGIGSESTEMSIDGENREKKLSRIVNGLIKP